MILVIMLLAKTKEWAFCSETAQNTLTVVAVDFGIQVESSFIVENKSCCHIIFELHLKVTAETVLLVSVISLADVPFGFKPLTSDVNCLSLWWILTVMFTKLLLHTCNRICLHILNDRMLSPV
jgi:hypothetical protein